MIIIQSKFKGVPKLIALISNDFNYSYIDDENDTTVFPCIVITKWFISFDFY